MYFTKALSLLSLALSAYAIATPHMARDLHHRAVVARSAAAQASAAPVAPSVVPRKRSLKRCQATNSTLALSSSSAVVSTSSAAPVTTISSSAAPVTASSAAPVTTEISSSAAPETTEQSSSAAAESSAAPINVGGAVPVFSSSADPTTAAPTTSAAPVPTTSSTPAPVKVATTSAAPQPTTSTAAPAATTSSGSSDSSFIDGTHTGQATFYATGLGACGITNTDTDFIAAASHILFDSFPGYNGVNPNDNPICNMKVTANYQGNTVSVTITDRCTACAEWDLDFSPSAFDVLADPSLGRLSGMTWSFDD